MTNTSSHTTMLSPLQGNRLGNTEAFGPSLSLSHVVQAAVRNIDDRALQPLSFPRETAGGDAKRLLAILAWSYAREIYDSRQIQSWIAASGEGGLWESGAPEVHDIMRFRSANRSTLQSCLMAALRFLAAQKVAEGLITRINEGFLEAEAARRVIMSMFIDSVSQAS